MILNFFITNPFSNNEIFSSDMANLYCQLITEKIYKKNYIADWQYKIIV